MKKITKIEPVAKDNKPKLRVAAYARVSTNNAEQLSSLETQKSHYEELILKNVEWTFAGLYFDEGLTGTSKDKRLGLQSLIKDCEMHKIDLILTKSISRFARNTMDCLEVVRKLSNLGIFIIFEKENINTQTMDGEVRLSILSSLAENESLSISENQKWSIEKRFQNGTFKISTPPFGYENIEGKMVINSTEASIVKKIFMDAFSGNGAFKISKKLNDLGVKPKRGETWTENSVLYLLKNKHYTGDVVFGKTYTDASYKSRINKGQSNLYIVQNHHEPIISHETFEKVQEIIDRRGKGKASSKTSNYQNRYTFSGKLICKECGGKFKRRVNHKNADETYIAWACSTHIWDKTTCSMLFIREEQIKDAFVLMLNKLKFGHDLILRPLLSKLRQVDKKGFYAKSEFLQDEMETRLLQLDKLNFLRTESLIDNTFYIKEKNSIKQDLGRLRQKKESMMVLLSDEDRESKVKELLKFVSSKEIDQEFNEDDFERFVEKIEVITRSTIDFKLKCGLILREELN